MVTLILLRKIQITIFVKELLGVKFLLENYQFATLK